MKLVFLEKRQTWVKATWLLSIALLPIPRVEAVIVHRSCLRITLVLPILCLLLRILRLHRLFGHFRFGFEKKARDRKKMGEAGHALYSTVIDAPLCKVWAHLRAFDKAPGIGSVIPGSVVNVNGKGSAELGVVRQINFGDQHVVETLVTLSDDEHVIAYVINSSSEKAFPGMHPRLRLLPLARLSLWESAISFPLILSFSLRLFAASFNSDPRRCQQLQG